MKSEQAEPQNLIEGLMQEMNRVREIVKVYDEIPAGFIASSLMRLDINAAERSITEGDTIKMLQAYAKLKETEM